jgi:hypothetical protein
VGPRTGLDDMEMREIFPLPGLETPTPRPSSYTDCAIPALKKSPLDVITRVRPCHISGG